LALLGAHHILHVSRIRVNSFEGMKMHGLANPKLLLIILENADAHFTL
jgi:hypothetical protein